MTPWKPRSRAGGHRTSGSFVVNFVLISVLLVVTTSAAVVAVIALSIRQQVEEQADRRLRDGALSFVGSMDGTRGRLLDVAEWLSRDSRLWRATAERHEEGALAALALPLRLSVMDAVVVATLEGEVIVQADLKEEAHGVGSLATNPGLIQALINGPAYGFAFDGVDSLRQEVYAPLRDPNGTVAGILRVSARMDEDDLQLFRARTGLDASLFFGETRVHTTLTGPDGGLHAVAADPYVAEEALGAGRSVFNWRDLPIGRYRSYALPLPGVDGTPVAMLSVAQPETAMIGEFRSTIASAVPAAAVVVVAAGLLAYVVAERVRQPILGMVEAAARMQRGDLATPVTPARDAVLAPLAGQLDQARLRLQADIVHLTRAEAWRRALLAALAHPVIMVNAEGRIVSLNPAAASLFGVGTPIAGLEISRFLPFVPDPRGTGAASSPAPGGPHADYRGVLQTAGQRTELEVFHSVALDSVGKPTHIYSVQDVSKHVELSRLREELLYNVAHELRVPLSVLENSLEILAQDYAGLSTSEFDQLLDSARRTTGRLHRLMQNLLNAGVIQSGRFAVVARPVPLSGLVAEAVEAVRDQLEARGQHLTQEIPEEDLLVRADARYLPQALCNLLTNASKYSDDGGSVRLQVAYVGTDAVLRVGDDGPGIAPEQRAGIFERFYRGEGAERKPGIGLGLGIVRGIVEAHGGRIGIESLPGAGTTAWFTVPLAEAEGNAPADGEPRTLAGAVTPTV